MVDRRSLLIVIVLLLIAILVLTLIWNQVQARKTQENARQMQQILSYIAVHDGEEFDYAFVSETFGISHKQIYRHLFQLETDQKIVAEQQYLRKPILITDNDYTNYYWKVYIASVGRQQVN